MDTLGSLAAVADDYFSDSLGDWLDRRDLSQKELAEHAGMTESGLSKWMTRGLPDSLHRFRKICRTLDVSADELLGLPPRPGVPVEAVRSVVLQLAGAKEALEDSIAAQDLEARRMAGEISVEPPEQGEDSEEATP